MTTLANLVVDGGIQTGPFGSQLHASDYSVCGVGVVMPQDLGDNCIDISQMAYVDEGIADQLSRHRLVAGDIVYSRRGDITRRAYVSESDGDLLCGTGCLRVRVDRDVADARFVSYAVATPDARTWLIRHAVGATMPNLNTTILGALPLQVPNLTTQRAIAGILGALDDKIMVNRKIVSTSSDLCDVYYRSACPTVSSHALGDIATIGGGGTPSTKNGAYWDGDVCWATPTDITGLEGPWLLDSSRTITALGLEACASPLYPRRSILMTSRATIGAIALACVPTAVNQGFIVVNALDPQMQLWLMAQMKDRTSEFLSWANGATFLEISRGVFKSLPFFTCELADLERFNRRAEVLLARQESAQRENQILARTRDELLPLIMSGKITVKQAEAKAEEVL
ncbi:hypothetical protein ABW16_19920 [Mycolicibacter heraklionensis]|uniref:Type I restriction modification DNA specificity domain-containing protein n=1 Tax=Mycolicibacter heraklionensis TaxID=512402 RepID=A0ABR5FAV6_9MYCO|nr:restriction endonuclease subunit S [Mycolicibacter heraklionensis]KLO26373.1 hypothetical protein ABW16_19920 [Mycolicibacter heraklionensis]